MTAQTQKPPLPKKLNYKMMSAAVAGIVFLCVAVYILVSTLSPARYNMGDNFKFYDYSGSNCSFMCFTNNPVDLSMVTYQTDLSLEEVRSYIAQHGGREELEPSVSTEEGMTVTTLHYYCSSYTDYYQLNTPAEKAVYESKWNKPAGSITHSALLKIPEHLVKHLVGVDELCN